MRKSVKIEATYAVNDSRNVHLTINVGDGQMGTSAVVLDGTPVGIGQIKRLKLGQGAALRGKKMRIKTVVTDVNDRTNRTSVNHILEGGKATLPVKMSGQVDDEGDSINYFLHVEFN